MIGKHKYKPRKGFENRIHVIGDSEHPILKIEKGKVQELFTDEFWSLFKIWEAFHAGMGLPGGKNWIEYDPLFIDIIINMERHYENNFSLQAAYLKAMAVTHG